MRIWIGYIFMRDIRDPDRINVEFGYPYDILEDYLDTDKIFLGFGYPGYG